MTQIETCHRGNIASYIRGFARAVGMHLLGSCIGFVKVGVWNCGAAG